MKLLFICGCLEPGKDGVGDYTFRLVEALVGLGHQAWCVAIHDRHLSAHCCYTKAFQLPQQNSIRVFRFSSQTAWKLRLSELRRLTESCEPDWISLQYVPYSFSKKGLPFRFTAGLNSISRSWNWHIMFHELWIGNRKGLKEKAISLAQKTLIRRLVQTLDPKVIHTSIQHYRQSLRSINIQSRILPLHSNIPVVRLNKECQSSSSDAWTFIFFGSLDSQWQTHPFYSLVEEARIISNKSTCRFVCLGRIGDTSQKVWEAISSSMVKRDYPSFQFELLGEKSTEEVSRYLHDASFGISMAPIQWIGKSGSVAAMIEHGLPVIVPTYQTDCTDSCIDSIAFAHQLLFIDCELPNKLCCARKLPPKEMATLTAASLLHSLNITSRLPVSK